jgi:hypothetical protein
MAHRSWSRQRLLIFKYRGDSAHDCVVLDSSNDEAGQVRTTATCEQAPELFGRHGWRDPAAVKGTARAIQGEDLALVAKSGKVQAYAPPLLCGCR